jgi:hypothetical protein
MPHPQIIPFDSFQLGYFLRRDPIPNERYLLVECFRNTVDEEWSVTIAFRILPDLFDNIPSLSLYYYFNY